MNKTMKYAAVALFLAGAAISPLQLVIYTGGGWTEYVWDGGRITDMIYHPATIVVPFPQFGIVVMVIAIAAAVIGMQMKTTKKAG